MSSAELYVLGSLTPEEEATFEARLREDEALQREVDELRRVAGTMALVAPEAEPPAGLKERVLGRVSGLTLIRRDDAQWVPTGVPGVEACVLWIDDDHERQTVLVRMAPGASYPCHRHAGAEECYVVSGDLIDGELRMKAGDYSRFDGATEHGPLSTEAGCLLLVTSSLHDEVVD